ncbi:substrate-binding periplasmic protein [Oceanicoccus sagamiensis]|uniref:Solute-binding protein family 3/N-terminal domain-containing protein n=1 Tax=Oceanicoccus sagamiensis TaxID=716816 RepID=A0A1X9NNM1_9GAMM|nr:transporter substrate-binding domain-containing protein [Oceanicoccus sagamiensis]ARN75493.1 hypothetical protein BST96_16070 [Oceanicoccus sagamiensis]
MQTKKPGLLKSSLLLSIVTLIFCNFATADSMRFSVSNKLSPPVPPYQWYDFCTSSYQGFNKELYQRLASDLGLKAEFIESKYAVNATDMQRYNLELIASGQTSFSLSHPAFIKDSSKWVVGAQPPLNFDQVIVILAERDDIRQLADLQALMGTGVDTTSDIHEFKKIGLDLQFKEAATLSEALQTVSRGDADYWIAPKFLALNLIEELALEGQVKFSHLKVSTLSDFYMVTSTTERNRQLINQIDTLVVKYREAGYIDFLKINALKTWLSNKSCAQQGATG